MSSDCGLMGYHHDFAIDGEVFSAIFSRIAESGHTLVLDIGSPGMPSFQPRAVARVAQRYPHMRIVVCRLLSPAPDQGEALRRGLSMMAMPNIWFDLAAIPWNLSPERYPYPTGASCLAAARDIVGAQKLVWGSNAPSTLTRERYFHLINYIADAKIFSQSELEDVFYNNACRAYSFR